ncbi:MAG: class I SAM-dependent methyltransferase [Prochloraceae cyanobacterium]
MQQNINKIVGDLRSIQNRDPNFELSQFKSLITTYQYDRLYRLFIKYIQPESKVLDWGCGNGHFSYFLVKMNYQTDSFSFADFLLDKHLSSADNYRFTKGNFNEPTTLPYPDNNFDAVVSVGVLEHVRETGGEEMKSLAEISRILKAKGLFICYHLPNKFSSIETIVSFMPKKYGHKYRYTAKEIKEICEGTGFEILELKRYGFLPRNFWGNYPEPIRNSVIIAWIYNFLDCLLGLIFSPLCQNYLFVARKKR